MAQFYLCSHFGRRPLVWRAKLFCTYQEAEHPKPAGCPAFAKERGGKQHFPLPLAGEGQG